MRRRCKARKLWRTGVLALMPAAIGLAAWTGWFTPVRPWEEATGWATIPAALRAPITAHPLGASSTAPEIRWLGHAGFLIRWHGVSLLLDPNTSRRCTVAKRRLEPAVPAATLGHVDAVLISHPHYDHLDLPTLAALPSVKRFIVPRGSEAYLRPVAGTAPVVALRAHDVTSCGPLEVTAMPAAHNGHRYHPLGSERKAVGYIIRDGETALYYAGDTGPANDFAAIRARHHPRLAILPIGAFAPRFPIGRYHLSPEGAVAAARALGVDQVIPCHFGTFTLSADAPDAALPRFARAAAAEGIAWSMPALLAGGTSGP